jgi:preprotein translocase subunit YajC
MAESAGRPELARVREGARVMATDGYAGKVTEVLVGDAAAESYVRVRTGGLFGRDRYVAAYDVRQTTEDSVWLKISRRDLVTTTSRTRPHAFALPDVDRSSVPGTII